MSKEWTVVRRNVHDKIVEVGCSEAERCCNATSRDNGGDGKACHLKKPFNKFLMDHQY